MLSKSFLEHFLRCGWSTIKPSRAVDRKHIILTKSTTEIQEAMDSSALCKIEINGGLERSYPSTAAKVYFQLLTLWRKMSIAF